MTSVLLYEVILSDTEFSLDNFPFWIQTEKVLKCQVSAESASIVLIK